MQPKKGVFISWSGQRSKDIATALAEWLPDVLHDVKPWMSNQNIHSGTRWGPEIAESLESINFGILCLTPENLRSEWIHYEAGCLSKFVSQSRVVPYLFALSPSDVPPPLGQFQAENADDVGTLRLLNSLNSVPEQGYPEEQVTRLFNNLWPQLKKKLSRIPAESPEIPGEQRDVREMVGELLDLVRSEKIVKENRDELPSVTSELTSSFANSLFYLNNLYSELDTLRITQLMALKAALKRMAVDGSEDELGDINILILMRFRDRIESIFSAESSANETEPEDDSGTRPDDD